MAARIRQLPSYRTAARALILDQQDHILLCRFCPPHPAVPPDVSGVWAAPGGGVEPGEDLLGALRRELVEEVGLTVESDPPHVWHQVITEPGHGPGIDGVINEYFLVRSERFDPRPSLSADEIASECISEFRWWSLAGLSLPGSELFSPRALSVLLTQLLAIGPPGVPLRIAD